VTGLKPGVVTLRDEEGGRIRYLAVSGGFVEVSENKVSILCDSCEPAGEIDLQRAKSALERAKQRLLSHDHDVDLERAHRAVERARARVHAAYLREGHRD
jgi:F-type H+-transporting ATPase subunit epsilon